MIYFEAILSPISSLLRCDQCQKQIRWPEEVRVYAPTLADLPTRIEHVAHTPQKGALRAE